MPFSSFVITRAMLFANSELRIVSTTLIVKSNNTLSIRFSALNQMPERKALFFRLTSFLLFRNREASLSVVLLFIRWSLSCPFQVFQLVFMNFLIYERFFTVFSITEISFFTF